MLGPVEVVSGQGRRAVIEGRRTRVLLGVLLVWRNQTVSLDFLIEGLWPSGPPPSAKGTLHAYVSRLRGLLGSVGPLPGSERITPAGSRL
jgi:DNA-binding SARP family transcriptional activator